MKEIKLRINEFEINVDNWCIKNNFFWLKKENDIWNMKLKDIEDLREILNRFEESQK